MREKLLVTLLLARSKFIDKIIYIKLLDDYFSKDTEDELLCELEWNVNEIDSSVELLVHSGKLDKDIFINIMVEMLKRIYDNNVFTLDNFAKQGYDLWRELPVFDDEYPLNIFCYADDPLASGDKDECREFINEILNYNSNL